MRCIIVLWIHRAGFAALTTRIAEVQDAGSSKERVLLPDTGYGFPWRLFSYWRLQERDGGVYVEWKVSKESLTRTLQTTRQALQASKR